MEVHNRPKYKEYKTALQWQKEGYVVKRRQKPHIMWTNSFCQISAKYYAPSQVRLMTDAETERYKLECRKKRARAQKRLMLKQKATERELAKRRREQIRFQKLEDMRTRIAKRISSIPLENIVPIYDVIVVDVETTGFEYEDELLQVSIIDGKGNVLYNSYLRPIIAKEWAAAEQVNGISPKAVKSAPTALVEFPKIAEILYAAKMIVGYNTNFDLDFLEKYGCVVSPHTKVVDIMPIFAEIYGEVTEEGEYKWQKLTTCADYYGFEWGDLQAHNSLSDCLATLHCYQSIV